MNDNNTFCTTTLILIRQSFLWQFSMALILVICINGLILNAVFTFIIVTTSQFDTVSRHLLLLCSSVIKTAKIITKLQAMSVGCVFRFVTIIQIHASFTEQAECTSVLSKPMECLTGFHFMHNVFVTINFNFYLGVLIDRIVVTWRTWRHPNAYAQYSKCNITKHQMCQTTTITGTR